MAESWHFTKGTGSLSLARRSLLRMLAQLPMARMLAAAPASFLGVGLGAAAHAQSRQPSVDLFDIIDAIGKVTDWLGWAAEVSGDLDPSKPLPSYPAQTAFASQLVDYINQQTARVHGVASPTLTEPVPSTRPPASGSFDATRDDLANRGLELQLAASELLERASILSDLKLAIGKVRTGKTLMVRLSEIFFKFAEVFPPGEWTQLFMFKASTSASTAMLSRRRISLRMH